MKIGDLIRNRNTQEVGLVIQDQDTVKGWIMIFYSADDITIQLEDQIEVINE